MGHDSYNSMKVMGSVTVFFGWYLVKLFSLPVFRLLSFKIKWFRKPYRGIKRNVFFRDVHRIFIETYVEFLVAFYFNYKYPLFTDIGDILGVIFGCICAFMTMIFIPASFWYILVCKKRTKILTKPIFF